MAEPKFDREFVRTALALSARSEVDRLLYVSDQPLSTSDIRGRPIKRKLVYAVTSEALAHQLSGRKFTAVVIPPYEYSRVEKIKVALVAAQSEGLVRDGDTVLALAGYERGMDILVRLRIGADREDQKVRVDTLGLPPEYSTQVVEQILHVAMEIGAQGYEGHPVGTIFVIGDSKAVMELSRQLLLNPFQAMSESERNCLDPAIRDALKTFATLDGAFVVREDGVVLASGRYLQAPQSDKARVPMGLGARHGAAAAMTAGTTAVAVTVSQTTGSVRVFKGGEIVLELHQTARRI